jgi:SET domain-containing protein
MIFISEKIEVKSSQIGGMGVFAKQDIKAGETLEVSYFTTLTQNFSQIDNNVWGYGSLYNHSRQNNADWDTDEENNVFKFFTIKDIKSGEEIFTNYGEAYEKIVKTVN